MVISEFSTMRVHGKTLVLREISSLYDRQMPNFLGTGKALAAVLLEGETLPMWLESQKLKKAKKKL